MDMTLSTKELSMTALKCLNEHQFEDFFEIMAEIRKRELGVEHDQKYINWVLK